jgi:hypothetical protein
MVNIIKFNKKKIENKIFRLAQLKSLCQDLHNQLKTNEDSRYDLEFKIRKQDYDVRKIKTNQEKFV